jgi:signal transduction histidine kinase
LTALLGVVAFLAIVAAGVAIVRARAARTALHASEMKHREAAERERKMEEGSRLAADVAHNLNDLLTAITGHTELLIAGLDASSPSIQDVHEIRRAAARAALLTKPLRALTGGDHQATGVVDVNAVIGRTVTALQQMLGPKIEVALALEQDVKRIRLGVSHLEEIVLNLGIHARDAMPHGGRLTVTTTMHTQDGLDGRGGGRSEYVRISVADSAGGISRAAQARLFEPFLAGEDVGGSAVGLAKVDAIVKRAGGRIQVESAAGVGTTFTIDLPPTSEAPAVSDPDCAEPRLISPVLVVEDDPRVRELIRLVLVRAGHEVVAVEGPHAALAVLKRQPGISLLLVDVVMPEMDGYDLVAEARTIARDVRVVFISGFAPDTTRQQSGDVFLAKPFTVESLTTVVQTALAP